MPEADNYQESQEQNTPAAVPVLGADATALAGDCPCGSGKSYPDCCGGIIAGTRKANSPEEVMRSRYTAFTQKNIDHLVNTIHPDHLEDNDRERMQEWADLADWSGLEVVRTEEGGPDDEKGVVEFIAHFTHEGIGLKHHELAHFAKHEDTWYYVAGENIKPQPVKRSAPKIGRNEPCPCGSEKKYKKCCGR